MVRFGAMFGIAAMLLSVHAQMFQNMFGGNSFFHAAQQGQEAHGVGDASWFQDRVDKAQCAQHLCSDTLACVGDPSACPCPYKEQIRCSLGDAYMCIQAADCGEVERLYGM
ncbi:Long chronological lifespan protein 2 [Malassezia vespertilionis]|uniref:Long chronological lifespan protein 2 n=1 Tax=Malassezia vespertilionis TaxID=2020962 RepID=A0A2N1JGW8_9BASI|nr:Long chronological lifespan protein 2 [Malassezia vespertilionis]PKI85792.1 hypothetical protein MVES_000285 [Malassezia vespertilionis]WFD04979.1 Long chronological lifespan protein 2 [Malassezia vespertilionis]